MNEKCIAPLQPVYLFKIILGLFVVLGLTVSAYAMRWLGLSPLASNLLLGMMFVVSAAIIPFVRLVYIRMDELQKLQHQKACVASLPIIAAASAVMGILQANDFIAGFNQFWAFGMVVAVWAINLMLADRRYR